MTGVIPLRNRCLLSMMAALLVILLLPGQPFAASFSGRVVLVKAGDQLDVLDNNEVITVRLFGIAVPEPQQTHARQAKEHTADLVAGQVVRVVIKGRTNQNQVVGDVYLRDGTSLVHHLVEAGYARQISGDPLLRRLEEQARSARRGIWANPHYSAPNSPRR